MNKKGFTLIELLIVIAIIGIIAAIAIPNLLTALQKGKQKATMGDIKSIGTAIESYITDCYIAPPDLTVLEPFWMKTIPASDGWGAAWHFVRGGGNDMDVYSIASGGRDRSAVAWGQSGVYLVTSYAAFDHDIIFSNGQYAYYPRVK